MNLKNLCIFFIVMFFITGCSSLSTIRIQQKKIEDLKEALEVQTEWSQFWYESFSECADDNYEELKIEEHMQVYDTTEYY